MTQNEKENEPWPGHDEAIAELQKWADSIPFIVGDVPEIRGKREHEIICDDFETKFLGDEKYQASLNSIYEGLGIPKELHA